MRVNDALTRFDDLTYPTTNEQLIEALGDDEIDLPGGSEPLADVFARSRATGFDSPDEVRLAFLSTLDSDAIGRKGYSDRDPPTVGESRPDRETL